MILYFSSFNPTVHFHKDVIQFPLNLARSVGDSLTVVGDQSYPDTSEYKTQKSRNFFEFIRLASSTPDKFVIMYFLSDRAKLRCILLHVFCPKKTIIVKADQNEFTFKLNQHQVSQLAGIKNAARRMLNSLFLKSVSLICVETESVFRNFSSVPEAVDKIFLLQNGSSRVPELVEKENIIVFVGRYESPQKNFELFLNAIKRCACALNGWRVEVVGGKKRDSTIEGVTFHGGMEHDQVMALLSKAKIFALSSLHEGSPIVFAEAKAAGCAILTTDVSSSKDYVPNAAHGEIATVSVSDYAEKLKNIISRCERSEFDFLAIREYYLENLDWKRNAELLAEKL